MRNEATISRHDAALPTGLRRRRTFGRRVANGFWTVAALAAVSLVVRQYQINQKLRADIDVLSGLVARSEAASATTGE